MTKATNLVTKTQTNDRALNEAKWSAWATTSSERASVPRTRSSSRNSRPRRRLHWIVDAAILGMLFSAVLKIWVLVGIAAMTLVGMFARAVWNKDPVYRWIGVRSIAALLLGGAVAVAMSLAE